MSTEQNALQKKDSNQNISDLDLIIVLNFLHEKGIQKIEMHLDTDVHPLARVTGRFGSKITYHVKKNGKY